MIAFECACGKVLKARDELAGKKTRCPECATVLRIPGDQVEAVAPAIPTRARDEDEDEDDTHPYDLVPTAPRGFASRSFAPPTEDSDDTDHNEGHPSPSTYHPASGGSKPTRFGTQTATAPAPKPSLKPKPKAAPKSQGVETSFMEYSYLLLFFALIPLMFSLLRGPDKQAIEERIAATLEQAAPEERQKIEQLMQGESVDDEALLAAMPGGRLAGAHLSRSTNAHWVYAALAAVAYLSLLGLCFSVERANVGYLFAIGAFTATVGIAFLFFVQFCSYFRFGRIRVGGIGLIIFAILAFIGWSYNSANDPDSGLILSAIGFTFGVGLCEEFTKAIPIFFGFRRHCELGWRTACVWGLASGIGFGVSEGIMYSARHYNGVAGAEIYLVRFISCVALHAMWSASVGIAIARNVEEYEGVEDGYGFGLFMLRVMAVPMVLHGLYDTLLKKDMNAYALLVALLSFGWLAWHIEMARGTHPHAGRRKLSKKFAY